ncbi:sugar ABC transporter substrate-binding protein [Streptomyces sp. RK62]|uniref:sugar ABC transporter substrate-binding protein n=1 Tax=Streptomyces sp. RK62 TaxID=2824893 RepID=UPI001B38C3DC|nr:substrate-binding domain-containing protein [Streptomyces sp. RK62]MBQ0997022.1 substrate-binding domain-containing protein [Streptomyces sp. RK62]
MNARTPHRPVIRRARTAVAAAAAALSLTACGAVGGIAGGDGSQEPGKGDDLTVGLLLPDKTTARFERFDHPLIKKEVALLTHGRGKVAYANAESSTRRQSRQFQKLIADRVDVILVDAVDSRAIAPDVRRAKEAGIPVIAYDRLAEGPVDAYVSHDNELVGEVQARALVQRLGSNSLNSKVVMMHGDPGDPNTARFKRGAVTELKGDVKIVKEYDVRKWSPEAAKENMRKAIAAVGADGIAAVYSANDDMAGAAIDALKEAGVGEVPPVTGQDANLDAIQRIVSGEQYMTVYKPFELEATTAARMAVYKVQGRGVAFDALTQDLVDSPTQEDIPAALQTVVAVTRKNIEDTVVADGVYTVRQICTPEYAADCAAIGLG